MGDVFLQQDSPDPELPELVKLLVALQESGTSIFNKREQDFLHVHPTPDQATFLLIRDNFFAVRALLPGYCDGCELWSVKRHEAYWGAHPHLCQTCVDTAVQYFERTKRWPSMQVPDSL